MKITVKIAGRLLDTVRADLGRRHRFAHERVGFLLAGAVAAHSDLLLLAYSYLPVEDDDYERCRSVGASIGSNAMRKIVEAAYRPQRAILHIHSHGFSGIPEFSGVDLRSAAEFAPGFGGSIPRMPHGIIVLSDDSAAGLLWCTETATPAPIDQFHRIGSPLRKQWSEK